MTATQTSPQSTTEERKLAFRAVGVKKHYPGVKALDGVDLEGYAGSVLAVCGANGAGKSTFAKLLAGVATPTDGEITITGFHPVRNAAEAERAGVLMMHQEPLIIDDFTVGENVWLYKLREGRDIRPWAQKVDTNNAETREVLRGVGLGHLSTREPARDLGPGQRQMLSLSRAAVTHHKIMILDETTASTSEEHFNDILDLVKREKEAGTSIIFVSHRLNEVFAMCDRIAVLRNGKLVKTLETAETTPDEITTLMIGQALKALDRPAPVQTDGADGPVLSVRDLWGGTAKGVSFDVGRGEILGLYGLVGSGRSSVARTVTGQRPAASGTIALHGTEVQLPNPVAAVAKGIAYLTEDRRLEGFVKDFTNGENMSLVVLPRMASAGVVNSTTEKRRVRELIGEYQVKGGTKTYTRTLSGGNQQKVVVAKWLETDPDFVVLDEPTKGIDVGARANIYEIIHRVAARGKGVMVVSSEAEELLSLCHRILVMRNGEIVAEFDPEDTDTDELIRTALTHQD